MLTAEALSYSVKFLDLFENAVIFLSDGAKCSSFLGKDALFGKGYSWKLVDWCCHIVVETCDFFTALLCFFSPYSELFFHSILISFLLCLWFISCFSFEALHCFLLSGFRRTR